MKKIIVFSTLLILLNIPFICASEKANQRLLDAAKSGNLAAIRAALYSEGVNVNATNDWNESALHLLARQGTADAMLELFQKGARADIKDRDGRTAFHWAAERGQIAAMLLLLQNGANKDAKDNWALTAASIAKSHGHTTDYEKALQQWQAKSEKTS